VNGSTHCLPDAMQSQGGISLSGEEMIGASRVRYYDTIAAEFDGLMNELDLDRRMQAVFNRMLGRERLTGAQVLDIGCGTGAFSLCALSRGSTVTSVDIGRNLLKIARHKGVTRPVQADARLLPFADSSFDLVISSECIEHTGDASAAVREMLRVLRPGGRLALTCPNRSWRWLILLTSRLRLRPFQGIEDPPSWEELAGWVSEAGGRIDMHFGLHALPFQLPLARRFLPVIDAALAAADRYFINQCLLAEKQIGTSQVP
jgi:SAM-dependent methyltransferase